MSSDPRLHLKNQVCLSMYSATNAIVRAYRPLLEPMELTYPQYLVMLALWENDRLAVKDICRQTRLETGTVTPLLKRLEAKLLIRREHSTVDERSKVISLTKEGQGLYKKAQDIPQNIGCSGALSNEEFILLKRLNEKLYGNLIKS